MGLEFFFSPHPIIKRDIIFSDEAKKNGIGTMKIERWKSFYEMMRDQNLYDSNLDYQKAFTLQFVNNKKWIGYENNFQ